MDTARTTTHVSLCAGYGGIDLGLKRAIPALRTIAFSEIEAFACANLVSKMEAGLLDPAPIWTDLKTFPWAEFRDRVDILSGGYPCQPFSAAGKRLGHEDPRHLWPFISAGIATMRPGLCFFENVEGHISLGLRDVVQDLGRMGYRTTFCISSASLVGAPHQRKRVFVLAHRIGAGPQGLLRSCNMEVQGEAKSLRSTWSSSVCGCGELADAERASLTGWRVAGDMAQAQGGDEGQGLQRQRMRDTADYCGAVAWPARPGEPQHGWEPPRTVMANPASVRSGEPADGDRPAAPRSDAPSDQDLGNANQHGLRGGEERNFEPPSGQQAPCGDDTLRPDTADQGREGSGRGAVERCLGDHLNGASPWLALSELSGLSHSELAEIHHWMVTTDSRTDCLRLAGNGVLPATAERAFRTLWEELQ